MNDDLVEHLPLVRRIVASVSANWPRHVDRHELFAAGVLGLIEAAAHHDRARGVPFEKYARARIRGAVLDRVRSDDWVPRSARHYARQLDAGFTLTPAQRTAVWLADRRTVLSLDRPVTDPVDEIDLTLAGTLADESIADPSQQLEDRERRSYVRDAVRFLPARYQDVIIGLHFEERTSQEVADELGVTQSRISQLNREALDMLRAYLEALDRPEERRGVVASIAEASRFVNRISESVT